MAVSPWIARGTVVNAPSPAQAPTPTSQFDTTSIIATANRIFGIADNMTARDAWAATFTDLVSGPAVRLRTDCPLTMPAPAPLTPRQLAAEVRMPLNDHHFDSLNLLCTLAAHGHPACAQHADAAAQRAYVTALAAEAGEEEERPGGAPASAAAAWAPAGDYPHLHAPAARRLRQGHFEAVSRPLWAAYKASVLAAAAAAAAGGAAA